ncbi:hypothetical protein [Alicyclobacillus fastidiosus]|uniref:Uncharacterized protein n=1 Tax=Alicyclobacillus fastidiosus TaxID=392011 RepID=A0ABV5A9V4_9BACL|nr:hypothetical protein [Alicyclobacillus fastidiosus]WEH10960.1 hypothetical protein PYS47_07015 [Alicyclobacillus fastidiosus]
MKERMDEMFGDVPNEIKLSEIVEKFKAYVIEHGDRDDDEITLDIDDPHSILTFISMDPKTDVARYQCRYRFHVDREGKIGGARIDGNDIGPRDAMGGLYGFEAFLFKMFAHKTKVILDIDDCDLEYHDTDDEDYD